MTGIKFVGRRIDARHPRQDYSSHTCNVIARRNKALSHRKRRQAIIPRRQRRRATPVGWVVLIGAGIAAGFAAGYAGDSFGKLVSSVIWDIKR